MSMQYDVIVIGGGPGGYVCAIRSAQLGLKTLCVEGRKTLGGTCLNVGCIPSKALLEASHVYQHSQHLISNGLLEGSLKPNLTKMIANKDQIVAGLTKGIEGLFKKNKVDHLVGFAKITDKNSVEVNGQTLTTKNIVIATGSEVTNLPNVTIDEEVIVSSTGALALKQVPKKMIVIGAGVIGLELGSVYSRLGTQVEVIEFLDKVTPTMDAEISKNFQKILEKQGIKFHLTTKVMSVSKKGNEATVETESVKDSTAQTFKADCVLVAVGRRPYTANLGLENVGITPNQRGFIEVNNHFQTSVQNIYAIGDVAPGPMLAHKAEEEGVAVAEIIAGQSGHVNYNLVPNVIYTSPEVASVGQTEEQLKSAGVEYNIGKFSMLANSRARAVDDSEGFVKILACKKTDRILGAHIISRSAGDIIHEVVATMEFGGSAEDLARTCHAHPTLNEAIKEACLAVDKRAIHS